MVLLAGEANPSSANPNPKEFWRALRAMCCVWSTLHFRGDPLSPAFTIRSPMRRSVMTISGTRVSVWNVRGLKRMNPSDEPK